MSGKLCDAGEYRWLDILLGTRVVDGALYLGLYKNLTELPDDTELSDIIEVSGNGYSRKTLTRGEWTIETAAGITSASSAEDVFFASGGDWGDIYGYFIATTIDNTGTILAVDHFDSYFSIEDGKGLRVTPIIKLD